MEKYYITYKTKLIGSFNGLFKKNNNYNYKNMH